MKPEQLVSELANFTGTEQYYKGVFGMIYTDGVKFLADNAGAYWLTDAIASYQTKDFRAQYPFQIWKLAVDREKKSAVLTAREDDGQPNIVTQQIEYTDFPLDDFELYAIDGVILLKSEY